MDSNEQSSMAQALDSLWAKFLPQMKERIAVLESAQAALAKGTLDSRQRAEANNAAHKLAGVLGTFGLTQGTVLAREAEILYSSDQETDPEAAHRLAKITLRLCALIEQRR